jgi:hypothetical protein
MPVLQVKVEVEYWDRYVLLSGVAVTDQAKLQVFGHVSAVQ